MWVVWVCVECKCGEGVREGGVMGVGVESEVWSGDVSVKCGVESGAVPGAGRFGVLLGRNGGSQGRLRVTPNQFIS